MSPVDLDKVQARADAATRGPWTARGLDNEWPIVAAAGTIAAVTQYTGNGLPNALFIAAARTDVPALVAELRAAREVGEALERWVAIPGMYWGDTPETGSEVGAALKNWQEVRDA